LVLHSKVRRLLTVLADLDHVRIVDGSEILACHRRSVSVALRPRCFSGPGL
jgi:hypothetical protein